MGWTRNLISQVMESFLLVLKDVTTWLTVFRKALYSLLSSRDGSALRMLTEKMRKSEKKICYSSAMRCDANFDSIFASQLQFALFFCAFSHFWIFALFFLHISRFSLALLKTFWCIIREISTKKVEKVRKCEKKCEKCDANAKCECDAKRLWCDVKSFDKKCECDAKKVFALPSLLSSQGWSRKSLWSYSLSIQCCDNFKPQLELVVNNPRLLNDTLPPMIPGLFFFCWAFVLSVFVFLLSVNKIITSQSDIYS
jgi:hypothetical protein